MPNIGVVIWLRSGLADVLHDLVLPLSRDVVAREDHLAIPPVRVLTNLLVHEILELFGELGHEHGTYRNQNTPQARQRCAHTGGNAVTVECLFFRELLPLSLGLLLDFSRLLGRSKPPTSLLVHLRTRGNPVDSHEKQLLRLDLPKQMIHVREYRGKNLLL